MKLLIAIPTTDTMPFQFVESLTKLIRRLDADEVDYDVAIQGGTLVYIARDKLAKRAISEGYSHVLWLDSDMVFNEDLLDDLMDSGKIFVTGIAHSRREPYSSCVFSEIYPCFRKWNEAYPEKTFKIAACGFACVLITTDIIKAVWDEYGTAFFPERMLGEDVAFCKRAAALGYEIWAEPSVRLGHVGQHIVYPEQQETYWNSVTEV